MMMEGSNATHFKVTVRSRRQMKMMAARSSHPFPRREREQQQHFRITAYFLIVFIVCVASSSKSSVALALSPIKQHQRHQSNRVHPPADSTPRPPQRSPSSTTLFSSSASSSSSPPDETVVDVLVVGSGIGGLSCAGMCSKYGFDTLCVEAHDTPGGVAHSFSRFNPKASKSKPFKFDSGPSLITGLSSKSTNPLRQVLDALDVADDIDWKKYDGWLVWDYGTKYNKKNNDKDITEGSSGGSSDELPNNNENDPRKAKPIKLTAGDNGLFEKAIEEKAGKKSREAFEAFRTEILRDGGLAEVSAYIPPMALRGGNKFNAFRSIFAYILRIITIGTKGLLLTGPFTKTLELYDMRDPFIAAWFDYLAFALSGVDASNTQGAPIAYMMSDLHRPGSVLDYPMGGMDSLIRALVNGLEKHGGEVRLNSRVERFLLEAEELGDNTSPSSSSSSSQPRVKCVGVQLDDGSIIRTRKGVVSNAPLWNYARILQDSVVQDTSSSAAVRKVVDEIQQQANDMSMTRSFMHLHLGVPKDGLPADLECHHSVLNWDHPVTDEQNMSIISIPTVFDPSLAPEGYHIIHAYTAAADNFEQWEKFQKETGKVGLSPNSGKSQEYNRSKGYETLKAEKAEVLWKAVECVIPDIRERATKDGSVVLVGTPLTHRRYNQRYKGTYGPGVNPGKDVWELAGATTPIDGLFACGDTSFPGIGLPGVAASGTIAANTIAPVEKQLELMNDLRRKGALQ
mmetsp:Transcript_26441/g.62944  ORF Transcript_26441/g.62944 Transcript_26441/m.62944 type:complete len:739 (-) Transcript_26441:1139-3355(-)